MKFLILSIVLLATLTNIFVQSLNQTEIIEKLKLLKTKLEKIDPNNFDDIVYINHLVQYNANYENTPRALTNSRVYVGCFADFKFQRMFRGYTRIKNNNNHIDYCISTCKDYRFVFAGAENGHECFCGNSAPGTEYNKRLPEEKCNKKCTDPTHGYEKCGADGAASVYRTGLKEIRQDENGNVIGDSSMFSTNKWSVELKT